jgi:class 3 adenylate cyclase/TolB-like protein
MDSSAVVRRLAAIVIADVVGYTRLMERDDTGTYARVRLIRDEVVDPAILSHGGRIVKTAGDGLVAEFTSALAALRASIQIQRQMQTRNAAAKPDERIDYRIGVNLGDIMVEGGDIAGDGVNVAARLEPLAEPGGICVSQAVCEQVRESAGARFVDVGDKQVKNITKPVRVFRVVVDGAAASARLRVARPRRGWVAAAFVVAAIVAFAAWRWLPLRSASEPLARSVLVAAFTTQDQDPQIEALARSLAPDVSRSLANSMRDATVVDAAAGGAPAANVRYALKGDVRSAGDDVVVTASLVDAASGKQVASEQSRIARSRAVRDRDLLVARTTATARQMIQGAETRRLAAAGGSDAESLVARAAMSMQGDLASARAARKLYEQAIDRDPSLVAAWLGHLYTLDAQHWYDLAAGRDESVGAAMERDSLRALELDDRDPRVWFARQVALEAQWRWEAALEANARGQALDPSRFSEPVLLLVLAGRSQEALDRIERRLAHLGKEDPNVLFAACNALIHLGRYEEALRRCERAVAGGNDYWSLLNLVAVYAHTGDMARATLAKDQLLRNAPDFTISRLLAKRFSDNPDWNESLRVHFVPAWRKAGVPE